jgi:hypothetical protein
MRLSLTAAVVAVAMLVSAPTVQARGGHRGGHGGHHGGYHGGHHGGHSGYRGGHHHSSHHSMHGHNNHHNGHGKAYHLTHGTKFSKGYYYRGRNHHHWSHRRYWSKYHCNTYFCPSTRGWYYWCRSRDCYLPVSSIDDDPPDVEDPEEDF